MIKMDFYDSNFVLVNNKMRKLYRNFLFGKSCKNTTMSMPLSFNMFVNAWGSENSIDMFYNTFRDQYFFKSEDDILNVCFI